MARERSHRLAFDFRNDRVCLNDRTTELMGRFDCFASLEGKKNAPKHCGQQRAAIGQITGKRTYRVQGEDLSPAALEVLRLKAEGIRFKVRDSQCVPVQSESAKAERLGFGARLSMFISKVCRRFRKTA